jgi:hypothetical protein
MYEEEPGRALMRLVQDALPLAAAAVDVTPQATALTRCAVLNLSNISI